MQAGSLFPGLGAILTSHADARGPIQACLGPQVPIYRPCPHLSCGARVGKGLGQDPSDCSVWDLQGHPDNPKESSPTNQASISSHFHNGHSCSLKSQAAGSFLLIMSSPKQKSCQKRTGEIPRTDSYLTVPLWVQGNL